MRLLFMLTVLLGCAAEAPESHAATLAWDYDLSTGGTISATALVQRGPAASGPFTTIATIPSLPSTYPEPAVPTGWTAVYYRIHNDGGDSNVAGYVLPVVTPTTTTDPRVDALLLRMTAEESKMAGVCRAAKAMGGSPNSFAGRIRKEVPCP
jgi:hypothetical protein